MKREIEMDYGYDGFVVQVVNDGKKIEIEHRGNALGLNDSIVSRHHPLYIPEECLAGTARLLAGTLCIKHAINGYRRVEGLLERTNRAIARA